MTRKRPDPDALLARVARSEARKRRGRLKIFFGAAAGVGKTFAMLLAARDRHAEHDDVVVGVVETHGRKDTAALLENLEVLEPLTVQHRGITIREFDLDGALQREPSLIVVDELAHTNAPGSRHPKRWQDVEELLNAGIDVYTALNVQHLESLHEDVGQITGTRVWETVPDTVFDEAEEVELVDLSPDELLARLQEGKVYLPQRAERAIGNFFRKGNLIALRQLALRRTAERVDAQMREYRVDHAIQHVWQSGERMLVCIGPSPLAERLVRAAKRLASSLHAAWIVLYVETPELQRLPPERRDAIMRVLRLAEGLGAETVTLSGTVMTDEILKFAREHNVTKLVMGKPRRKGWRRWFLGSVVDTLLNQAPDLNFYLLGRELDEDGSKPVGAKSPPMQSPPAPEGNYRAYLGGLAAPLVCTLLTWPFRESVKPANMLLVYLLGVFFVAIKFGRGPSILASVLTAAAFAFFYAPPIFSFAISEPENVIGLAVMLVVAVVTSNLTENVRSQARIAAQRERRASVLYQLSKELASARRENEIVLIAVYHLHAEFESPNTIIFPDQQRHPRYPREEPLPISLKGADLGVVQWVMNHGMIAGRGTDTLPGEPALYLPLNGSEGTLGVWVMEPVNLRRVFLPEQKRLLDTFLHQIVQALERVRSVEQAKLASIQIEAETLRNSLLSSISHDLRTPLAMIVGATGRLEEGVDTMDPERRRKLIRAVHEEARRMADQTGKILEMARLESGKVVLNRQWIVAEEIVGSALQQREKALQGRSLQVSINDGLQLVFVDVALIQQVMLNLLDNALKYSPPETPIDIIAEVSPYALKITVEDRGPGIPEGLEQKIFEKFFQVHAESAQSGVGLGLAICKAIIEAHGGEIHATNRETGGACFQIILPTPESPPVLVPPSEE
ncbi:MAG TPA: sensor histidine kinase KdpD [Methylococcaceae bacterium]|jgi:two-component system sensor histidine kinase KdpD|nr:sensor histidine kinase KdpD [Methylococcaceae bacterium]